MKKLIFSALFVFIAQFAFAQSGLLGTWKTIDDVTNKPKSHIEIIEKDGKYYGKVTAILTDKETSICNLCEDYRKDQPIMGMEIVKDLKVYKDYYSYGTILDPNNGKIYKCSIWLEDDNTLSVRGYIGFSALGRSQKWFRVNK